LSVFSLCFTLQNVASLSFLQDKKRSVNAFTVEENILDTFSILPRPSPEHRLPQALRLLCFGFLLIFCNFAAQRRALFLFARHH
ncbi:MAG: hypothetical protein KIG35_08240, partial [Prevotellamassilia sp.]|nr:hypothetical protein [Prevotellamassilia sp.]